MIENDHFKEFSEILLIGVLKMTHANVNLTYFSFYPVFFNEILHVYFLNIVLSNSIIEKHINKKKWLPWQRL